ncbi:hypothetical protein L7F22_045182 [Adiantum nelumboides]|nr:hypothetical protein [Adiantum nelumboides]
MASSSESGNLLHIRKLEGAHNFSIWKKQCYNVMLKKKQAKPIKLEGRKLDEIEDEEWEEMDELARSTIMLSVSDSLLFNVENEKSAWGMWKRLELFAVFESDSLDLVHSDVCEMPQLSLGGKRYFVSFIDDATRKVWVYPLRAKSDVLDTFKKFLAFVENQTGKKLRSLRSDNEGEYVSKAFIDFCATKGIKRELTAPFNPSQNGVAERLNRTIQEKVRSMLSHAALPHGFWAEAVQTAIHLINRSPSKALGDKVPEECWGKGPL